MKTSSSYFGDVKSSSSYFSDVIRNSGVTSEYSVPDSNKLSAAFYLSNMAALNRGHVNLNESLYTPESSPNVNIKKLSPSPNVQCALQSGSLYEISNKTEMPKTLPSIGEFGLTMDRRCY